MNKSPATCHTLAVPTAVHRWLSSARRWFAEKPATSHAPAVLTASPPLPRTNTELLTFKHTILWKHNHPKY